MSKFFSNAYQDETKLFYLIGVRGVGKTTLLSNCLDNLTKAKIKTVVLPEWKAPPPPLSPMEFCDWILSERIERDQKLREIFTQFEIVLCDRSPLCILAYAYANLDSSEAEKFQSKFEDYSFLPGHYVYLKASPRLIYRRLQKRNGPSWNEKYDRVRKAIIAAEAAYSEVFTVAKMQPHTFVDRDYKERALSNKMTELILNICRKHDLLTARR